MRLFGGEAFPKAGVVDMCIGVKLLLPPEMLSPTEVAISREENRCSSAFLVDNIHNQRS